MFSLHFAFVNNHQSSNMYFCGFNGFGQLPEDNKKLSPPKRFKIKRENDLYEENIKLISISWSYNVYAVENELIISGFINKKPNQLKHIKMDANIIKICSNDKISLILLENNSLHKFNVNDGTIAKINLPAIKNIPLKRKIFNETEQFNELEDSNDKIEHIACGTSMFIAITKSNAIFSLPVQIDQLSKHIKIMKLVCGFEHFLILNSNGDIYTSGNGLRGQLGHMEMEVLEVPKLIDALGGIKMISISAGGWHSASISAFGDLYVWGSNVNGQLGLKRYNKINDLNAEKELIKKNATVFPLPQIIDLPPCCNVNESDENETKDCNASKVFAGARHTFVQMSCGKLFSTGWNKYGQLGNEFPPEDINQDFFRKINVDDIVVKNVLCGPWSTIFL